MSAAHLSLAIQRRTVTLPCDGVRRYKVGKALLNYSEARKAICTMTPTMSRGEAMQLAALNRKHFRLARDYVLKQVQLQKSSVVNG